MSHNIRKRKTKLWNENNGKCYWCGVKTVLPIRKHTYKKPVKNLATLDHLRTRFDKDRSDPNYSNQERTVLSCYNCNVTRGLLAEYINKGNVTIRIDENNIFLH